MNFNKDFCIVVNTVSDNKDVWNMFFSQLDKHCFGFKTYVFTDDPNGLPNNVIPIIYDPKDNFRTQYLKCIKQVDEQYCLYLNEDYILYNDVDVKLIEELLNVMESTNISLIRLLRGPNITTTTVSNRSDLFYMDTKMEYFFSQNATLWKTRILEEIHLLGPDLHIADKRTKLQFEIEANKVCHEMGLVGAVLYQGEQKRGRAHYDSNAFPYIATAIIKGKWNLRGYYNELIPLLKKYNIDWTKRGSNEN